MVQLLSLLQGNGPKSGALEEALQLGINVETTNGDPQLDVSGTTSDSL